MLLALLLQSHPDTNTVETIAKIVLWVIASATALDKIWGWLTGGAKAKAAATDARFTELEAAVGQFVDRDALEKRFGEAEAKHKLVAAEVANQHNTLHEYERKRTELSGEFRANIGQLQEKVHTLETMPGRVTSLETKLDNLVTQITDLKEGQRTLKQELREDMRGNKGEILAAIKDLKTS